MADQDSNVQAWRPSAEFAVLHARAEMLASIRSFFSRLGVIEVETPLLCKGTVTDPNIAPIACGDRWLQTSPEYAMKRLLCAGSGPIYQVCKAFRQGESGPRHNPEFSLLEWYRPGFSLRELMSEVAQVVELVLGPQTLHYYSYLDLFLEFAGINPFTLCAAELEDFARQKIDTSLENEERDTWLDLLLSHVIEPQLKGLGLVFVYDYPASQAALARIRPGENVAERFELYADGIELANGYLELADAQEQAQRWAEDRAVLASQGLTPRPSDEYLHEAMLSGLPDCSGVAMGLDRLLMLKLGVNGLAQVISFDWERA